MARVQPNSNISFYRGVNTKRLLAFSSQQRMESYFNSKKVVDISNNNYTTVKKRLNMVRVNVSPVTISGCDFLSFRNPSFDNKTYYARILDYDYVNNECVEVTYAIDLYYTYLWDMEFGSAYVDREHMDEPTYNKSKQNPYTLDLEQHFTPEPLMMDQDMEKFTYTLQDQATTYDQSIGFYALAKEFGSSQDSTLLLFSTPVTPPGTDETKWYNGFRAACGVSGSGPSEPVALAGQGTLKPINGTAFANDIGFGTSIPNSIKLPLEVYMFTNVSDLQLLLDHFTLWNATSAVVGLYEVPNNMLKAIMGNAEHLIEVSTGKVAIPESIHSRKLCCFPYCYMRVISPDGNEKEYKFENFSTSRSEDHVDLAATGTLNGAPSVYLVPYNYKYRQASQGPGASANFNDRISFSAFPQMPYSTDSFLAFLAAKATDLMRSNTYINSLSMQNTADQLELQSFNQDVSGLKTVQSIGAGLMSRDVDKVASGVAGLVNNAYASDITDRNQEMLLSQIRQMKQSDELSISNLENNEIYKNYKAARPSFVKADYHQGSEGGYELYDQNNPRDFRIVVVCLRADMLEKYDMFFRAYGYNTGAYKLPNIVNYFNGRKTGNGAPHWEEIPGLGNVTYVKTTDMSVKGPLKMAEEYFKALFNGGVQFINGED